MPKDEEKAQGEDGKPGEEGSPGAATGAASTPRPTTSPPAAAARPARTDAVSMLKQDHRAVEDLFSQYESASEQAKPGLVRRICDELTIHTMLEEEIFYPASETGATEALVQEARVEHDSAKVLILDLLNPRTENRDAKVKVLAEQIRTHIKEEEAPDGLFAQSQKSGADTPGLAEDLRARKQQLELRAEASRLPSPRLVSLSPTSLNLQTEESMNRQGPGRDEYGRFTSDDDRGHGNGDGLRSRSRYDQEDERRYASRGRDYDDDRGGGRGWRGDAEGHAQASRRGWDERGRGYDEDDRRYASRGGDYDDDRGGRSRGQGGWFGDPAGHSEASRRGWDEREGAYRGGPRYAEDRSFARGRDDDDDRDSRGRRRGGWFGDSEGHADASREGWDERRGDYRARSRGDDDDDRRHAGRGGRDYDDDRDGRSRGRGQGGWFGDSAGHAEAARRGWDDRR